MDNIVKTYVVSDTHWSHDKMVQYCGRPPNFNKLIISQWRATVQPQDIVCHLGDVIWGSQGQLIQIMNGLPGTKILIKGNHDRDHSNNWFIQTGFSAVFDKVQIAGCILSHFPAILNKEEIEFGLINIFGHFHNSPVGKWEKNLKKRITPNHYLFCLEDLEYKPISLEKIRLKKFVKNAWELLESESGK